MSIDSINFACINNSLDRIKDSLPDKSKFNIMDVFCMGRSELAHSNFISYILDQNYNGKAGTKIFLDILKKHNVLNEDIDCDRYTIHRELHHIDILIKCSGSPYIVAIENKLYSSEGENQLKRYQSYLGINYPQCKTYLLFLTPSGRDAVTADEDNQQVPCIPISYEIIIELIDSLVDSSDVNKEKSYIGFLEIIKKHLEVNVVTNKKLKRDINKIWGDPAQRKALKIVNENRPNLSLIKDSYVYKAKEYVSSKYNDDLLVHIYPETGNPKEIKLSSKILSNKGVNIHYMFFDYPGDNYPCFRVVIAKEDYYKSEELYEKAVEILGGSIFAKLSEIPGWSYWMSLLLEDNSQPDHTFKDKHEYGEDFVIMAFDVFKRFYDKVNGILYRKI